MKALLLLLFLTAPVWAQPNPARLAKTVTIYRDAFGVPHVYGRTDASTVFGFAYAQAQDNFWRVEENFIQALGRSSELYDETALDEDRLNHALEIPRLAREEYSRLEPRMRALCDAFAAGFNFYLARHPEVRPRLLQQIEPWYTLAFIRYNYFQNGFAQDPALLGALQTAQERGLSSNVGSNGWVINPSRSKSGYAMFEEIRVKTSAGFEVHRFKMIKTHHGPVLSSRDGKLLAIRMAKFEGDGWLREWYDMTRARTLGQFKAALRPLNMLFGNVMYADRRGNTYYLYNGAVPRRDTRFDWTRPVDGSDPATEWKGFHTIEELPQLTNPRTGWMQNCNTTPFLLTSEGNPDAARFPPYMVQESDNPRGRMSRKILSTTPSFSFEEWTRAAFDTRVITAEELLPQFLTDLKEHLYKKEQLRLSAAYDVLWSWDYRAKTDSVAMTIFNAWRERITARGTPMRVTSERRVAALNEVLDALEQRHGTWRVAWGEINRLQRRDESKKELFSDERPSFPVPGANGGDGAVYTFYARPVDGQKRRYGVGGASYVSVVEFAPEVRALSIHVFGASGDPKSRHFTDQATLYARGEFKPAWLTLKEIRANLESSYRPGDR
jgi:acyl-homoserine lactone acylase PvdQ